MTNRLSGKMWTFCHMIFGTLYDVQPAVKLSADVFQTWFLDTLSMSTVQLPSKMLKYCQIIFEHVYDVKLAIKKNVDHSMCWRS